jgi:hypothetical protein
LSKNQNAASPCNESKHVILLITKQKFLNIGTKLE